MPDTKMNNLTKHVYFLFGYIPAVMNGILYAGGKEN